MPRPTTTTFSLTLSAAPRSAAMARSALNRLDLDPDTHADVALLTSELVSAAIHAVAENGDAVAVEVSCGAAVRVEVTAASPALAALGARDELAHGFTIRLLDDLASSWDGGPAGDRTMVWFEVRVQG